MPATPAQEVGSIESEATALSLSHDAVTCMVANEYPRIDASLVPEPSVQAGAGLLPLGAGTRSSTTWRCSAEGGRFVGTLPRPNVDAGPVTYYVEGLGRDFTQTQTGETRAAVVEQESECKGRVATIAPLGRPVQVFSLSGTTALPPGFSGVSSVLAAGAGTTGAAAATGAGGFLTSTGGLILMGAAAVGIATAIVVTGGEDPPPASGSR